MLERAGVTLATGDVDLRVGTAPSSGTAELVVERGDTRRQLRSAGYGANLYLALPDLERASLFVPVGLPGVGRYALGTWTFGDGWKGFRNKLAGRLVDLGRRLPGKDVVTVASRTAAVPYFVATAEVAGLVEAGGWFLVGGRGDALSRGVFYVFRPRADRPEWVIKFARAPGYREPFERDERALALVAEAGGSAAARAPAFVGRLEAGGIQAAVETAAVGRRLNGVLRSGSSRREKLALVDEIAAWTLAVQRETASADRAAPELERLCGEVLPPWDASGELVDRLAGVPVVLVHNDLGSWNVLAENGGFTVVDWEGASRSGLPLWDLWYFLADALAELDCSTDAERAEHFERLFRGEAPSSERLFHWTRETVAALDIPHEAVGALATLCWMHHGLSWRKRQRSLDTYAQASGALTWAAEHYARRWLTSPGLGATWSRWNGG